MNKLEVAKAVVNLVVGAGTTKIVKSIIVNNTDPETVPDKVAIATSSVVIGMMAADATKEYTSAKIDKLADAIKKFRSKEEPETEE